MFLENFPVLSEADQLAALQVDPGIKLNEARLRTTPESSKERLKLGTALNFLKSGTLTSLFWFS